MCRPLFNRGAVMCLVALGALGAALASSAQGQIPSDVDTMRIVDVAALPGDTVSVDFYLRNINVLGAYDFRLRYDPLVIEPLTDSIISGNDTTLLVEAQQLRGTSFEQFSGVVLSPGLMTFLAVDFDRPADQLFPPGGGVAVRMRWRALPGVSAESTTIDFENDPVMPQSWNTIADLSGLILKRPVLVSGLFEILTCACGSQGDVNNNGLSYELSDLIFLLSYTFSGGSRPPKDPSCYHINRGDITCDGAVDVMDVVRMINIVIGRSEPTCDPCACSPYPGGCP